ncbi:HET-domain-containing protein, partial [Hyaloscypha hepaticicola]
MAVYNPLLEKDEIRLLRLEPGVGSAQVKFSLFHARLGKSPTYDAVSYMWGHDDGPGKPKTALSATGGRRAIQIQENLGNALRHLRLKDKARTLWVDAICVDQANDDERGHQIAQMGKIYSQATTVRVWLG